MAKKQKKEKAPEEQGAVTTLEDLAAELVLHAAANTGSAERCLRRARGYILKADRLNEIQEKHRSKPKPAPEPAPENTPEPTDEEADESEE